MSTALYELQTRLCAGPCAQKLQLRQFSGKQSRCNSCRADQAKRRRLLDAPRLPKIPVKTVMETQRRAAVDHVQLASRELAKCQSAYPKAVASGDQETAEVIREHIPALIEYVELTRRGREPSERWQLTKLGYKFGARGAAA